jgi:hypothetical protein
MFATIGFSAAQVRARSLGEPRSPLSGASAGWVAELNEPLRGRLAAAVGVAGQKRCQALVFEAAGDKRAGVARTKRQADQTVDLRADAGRGGPKALNFGAQLVGERDACRDEILAGATQGAQRVGVVAVANRDAKAMMVAAGKLAEHERGKAIELPGAGTKARPGGRNLVGIDRHHPQPAIQQPLDQPAIPTLNRDKHDLHAHQRAAQRWQAALVMRERRAQQLVAAGVLDEHVALLANPVQPRMPLRHRWLPSLDCASRSSDRQAPLRALIDGPSTGLRPVVACNTSPRREKQISCWPSTGKHRRLSQAGAQAARG